MSNEWRKQYMNEWDSETSAVFSGAEIRALSERLTPEYLKFLASLYYETDASPKQCFRGGDYEITKDGIFELKKIASKIRESAPIEGEPERKEAK